LFYKRAKNVINKIYQSIHVTAGGNMTEKLTQIGDLTQVFKLQDLTSYQEHSVVSREIIRKPSGTMTVFAFDQGEGLSEHTAPFDAVVYILEGEAEIRIEGKPNTVKAGEMIIMPANKPHALKAITRYKMLLMMIK
jgi:quercetin dioxygenase-like cupin family protein